MAVQYDSASQAQTSVGTNCLAWNHTIGANDNRILIVFVGAYDEDANDTIVSDVKYGGVSMTYYNNINDGGLPPDRRITAYYMLAPATGVNQIQVYMAGGIVTNIIGGAISIYDANQAAPDVSVTKQQFVDTITQDITTLVDGSIIVDGIIHASTSAFTANNQTERFDQAASANACMAGSTRDAATSGAYTNSWTSVAAFKQIIIMSFAPIAGTAWTKALSDTITVADSIAKRILTFFIKNRRTTTNIKKIDREIQKRDSRQIMKDWE